MSVIFGQLVIGPPGSGKTTYCNAMSKFLEKIGRKVAIVNIDPANENMEYKPTIDVSQLVKHEEVMAAYGLGPNGALVYCMEFLEANIEWLIDKVLKLKDYYLIFDCPGQNAIYIASFPLEQIGIAVWAAASNFLDAASLHSVELYTHHKSVSRIAERLGQNSVRLCSLHLVDSHHCSDPGKYLSSLMLCTSTMLQLGLPHVNVLTKLDQMKKFSDRLAFNIDFYTEVLDLQFLLEKLDEDPFTSKYKKLNAALVSLVEDYSLVSFVPLDVSNQSLLLKVKNAVDKANGYIYGGNEPQDVQTLLACAVGAVSETERMSTVESYI